MLTKRNLLQNYTFIVLSCLSLQLPAIGLLPVPTMTDVSVSATVELEDGNDVPNANEYRYTYSISNSNINTGDIWYIKVDLSSNNEGSYMPSDTSFPVQGGKVRSEFFDLKKHFDELANDLKVPNIRVIPFGQNAPSGWNGGFGRDGFAGFSTASGTPAIEPGQTVGEFGIIASRVPSLRKITLVPKWMYVVENHDAVTDEESKQAAEVAHDLKYHLVTLGPSFFAKQGGFDHWNQFRDDINQMGELGWISTTLATTLSAQLAEARSALDETDGTLAKKRLQPLVDIISNASASDMNAQAKQLLVLNTDSMLLATEDTLISFEPEFTITPLVLELEVGELYELSIKVTNKADQDATVPGFLINFFDEGSGTDSQILTDIHGIAVYRHIGKKEGIFPIHIFGNYFETYIGKAVVTWKNGVDLVVLKFIPPIIRTAAGNLIYITDITLNIGTKVSPPSVTRYFLSSSIPVDPTTAVFIGERSVPALLPEGESNSHQQTFVIPSGIAPGLYYMVACADASEMVVEKNEMNNCSSNRLDSRISISIPVKYVGPEQTIFDLTARAKSGKINIAWSPVEGAESYNVYRSTTIGGPYTLIQENHVTDYAVYADFGLTDGITYSYVVRSVLGGF